jgi:hypothetical protein
LVVSGSLVAILAPVMAQQDRKDEGKKAREVNKKAQRTEGVILKVEPARPGGDAPAKNERKRARQGVRLTINTAVVWRDWVRDQADLKTKPDAEKGADSVATKGQPAGPNDLVTIVVGPRAHLATRLRSSTDETDKGARTVAGAEKKEERSDPDQKADTKDRDRDRAPRLTHSDLKPGLFVLVEYRRGPNNVNRAEDVTILKPVGGPETPVGEEKPAEKK